MNDALLDDIQQTTNPERTAMKVKVRKFGNVEGVVIPKPILSMMGLKLRDLVDITVEDGSLVVSPVTPAGESEAEGQQVTK